MKSAWNNDERIMAEAGKIRTSEVGVYNEKGKVIYIAPPAKFIKSQTQSFFDWVNNAKVNMLIRSGVFHYEFAFLHPFKDGNGRTEDSGKQHYLPHGNWYLHGFPLKV